MNRQFAKLRDEIQRTRKGGCNVQNEHGSAGGNDTPPSSLSSVSPIGQTCWKPKVQGSLGNSLKSSTSPGEGGKRWKLDLERRIENVLAHWPLEAYTLVWETGMQIILQRQIQSSDLAGEQGFL